eukprot:jgi/Mesvir1/16267/Mv08513-RA.1
MATSLCLATSWVDVPENSDFPIQNLPYGVFTRTAKASLPAVGVAIGNHVVDLAALHDAGLFKGTPGLSSNNVFASRSLNAFLETGRETWRNTRARLIDLLRQDTNDGACLRDNAELRGRAVVPMDQVSLHMPVSIGNFTDFYCSLEHATNVGRIFRPVGDPLNPNWRQLPVGYHGRAGTVFVSPTPVTRPCGQILASPTPPGGVPTPVFSACRNLDFELEMGFVIGAGNDPGTRIPVDRAEQHIFGMVLLNDWSARDIQLWEYIPLGPFLSKSFATCISPWVVPMDALEPFRTAAPTQDPPVLSYLRGPRESAFDIHLEALLQTKEMADKGEPPQRLCRSNLKHLYWTMAQMLAHHTCNGTGMRPGDLIGTGTVSSPAPDGRACLMEITRNGADPLTLSDGSVREYLNDGDTVVLRGWCEGGDKDGPKIRIGFGEVTGKVLPSREPLIGQ